MTIVTSAPVEAGPLTSLLTELAPRFGVAGAVLAVHRGGQTACAVTGVTNVDTGVPVTRDTVFQVGSITKVYVATMVMQLVDDGLVELDRPVAQYLPELRLASAEALSAMTVRHLLTHTCGLESDYLLDLDWGDDNLARYVATFGRLGQLHPPGAMFSYCNSGYVLATYLVERLRGVTWHDVLRTRILEPLGATHTETRPVDALRHNVTIGHVPGPDLAPRRFPVWAAYPVLGPAGSTMVASVDDVIAFARTHLDPDSPVLSAAAAAEMRRRVIDVPVDAYAEGGWSSGWMRTRWSGADVFGHDGSNLTAQFCGLRIVPEHDLIICVLTNSGTGSILTSALLRHLVPELTGLRVPEPPAAGGGVAGLDPERYTGRYERLGQSVEVTVAADGKGLDVEVTNDLGPTRVVVPARVDAIDEVTFGYIDPPSRTHRIAAFDPDGEYLTFGFRRAHRRVRRGPRP